MKRFHNVRPINEVQKGALAQINEIRKEHGFPPRKTLSTGFPGAPDYCPIANSFPPSARITVGELKLYVPGKERQTRYALHGYLNYLRREFDEGDPIHDNLLEKRNGTP